MSADHTAPTAVAPEPARLVDRQARGDLGAAEARLATLMAATSPPAGLDEVSLRRVQARLFFAPPPRRRRLAARIAVITSTLVVSGASMGLAAHLAGWQAPARALRALARPVVGHHTGRPAPAAAAPASADPASADPTDLADLADLADLTTQADRRPRDLPLPAEAGRGSGRGVVAFSGRPVKSQTPLPHPLPAPRGEGTRSGGEGGGGALALAASASASAPGPLPATALSPPPLDLPAPPGDDAATSRGRAPPAVHVPGPLAAEAALLGEALSALRRARDGQAALQTLDEYTRRFPQGVLAPEAMRARIDALFLIGARDDARRWLDTLALAPRGRDLELLVVRGELRAASDCGLAEDDFSRALAAPAPAALRERALHGRATCRARRGDEAGAARDRAEYLRQFPTGRFAPTPARTPNLDRL